MIYSAGDLDIEIDFGPDQAGAILQRKEKGYWHDYMVDGETVVNPFDVETLPAGWYQLRSKSGYSTQPDQKKPQNKAWGVCSPDTGLKL